MPDSPDINPNVPVFGELKTGGTERNIRKPNQEKPIELGLDIPRTIEKKEGDELTIPLNSTEINPDPDKQIKNPYITFGSKTITVHSSSYGYGAGGGEHFLVEAQTPIRFLTPPTRNEGMWNWYVLLPEGRTAFIWTEERKRGTLITYEKNKPPLVNFIVEDIRN